MRLSNLQLQGFKTFAERTEIAFAEGVTAIVGPNGSGKSNLGDAILWVLGDKASSIRGAKASDVIFAGTDKRRPVGMAEVSLTVDNSDGTLPVPFAEVTVTRRAYRTGDAEYFLNKVPCRLKDIAELFLDTGVGREGYALVGQSQIDAVLSADPAERRGLFEEAAGIKKYRVKKRDALRKLDATQANVTRVADILHEMQGRLEPLRLAAETAERFHALRDRLRAIETGLLITDVRFAHAQWDAARAQRREQEHALADAAVQLGDAKEWAQRLASELSDADAALDAARHAANVAGLAAERAESARVLAVQRADGLRGAGAVRAGEREELNIRLAHLERQVLELAGERDAARADERGQHTQSVRQGADVHAVTERIHALNRDAQKRQEGALARARQAAARQADAARAEARYGELERGLPALRAEAERLDAAARDAATDADAARAAVDDARFAVMQADTARAAAQATRDSAHAAAKTAARAFEDAQGVLLSTQTRLRALQELEQAQEGYFAGVRAVHDGARSGKFTGAFTTVADAFRAPPGYETAFETALAASLQDIITDTEASAKAAIRFLHDGRLGRATFLPLDRMQTDTSPRREAAAWSSGTLHGVRGAALDIAEFDPKYRPALDVLLGRVFICDTLDDAIKAGENVRGWSRIVTLTGEIVLPTGALTGGRQAGKSANLLGRKTEIAQLTAQVAERERDLPALRAARDAANADADAADAALSDAHGARQGAASALADAERQAGARTQEARRLTDVHTQAVRRLAQADEGLNAARDAAARAVALLMDTAGPANDAEDDAARAAVQALAAERDTLQSALTGTRIALATAAERAASLDRAARAARAEADGVAEQISRRERQAADADAEYAALVVQAQTLADAQKDADAARVRADAALDATVRKRAARLSRSQEIGAQLRALTEARAAALELIHKGEVRETRLETQVGALVARLRDEYEITLADALALPEDPDIHDGTPQEVARLRRELRQMGEVNTGAVAEWDETRARHEFLTTQKADLDEARARLLTAITEIDDSTRGVFLETFTAVGIAFADIFARLFGGGKTELLLTTPDDILETGIDVLVQPPGKKRQPLALLSGGERALTAAALLFAFLVVRPAPFCVLDEVDAPLDGANVERFADLLREFGARSQMIVITHNPTTMEAAPLWYGITMPEPGVSRVLSMKVPEAAS